MGMGIGTGTGTGNRHTQRIFNCQLAIWTAADKNLMCWILKTKIDKTWRRFDRPPLISSLIDGIMGV